MNRIRFYSGEEIPVEMHKVRIVQKLSLLSVKERLKAVQDAGSNTFLLKNRDVYLDMLTDSGVNAMSDRQLAAMMEADDSYAGSETFARLEAKCTELFGTKYFLPAHQGRACEHILAKVFVKPGTIVPMNYHFTTTKAHIVLCGGSVVETPIDEAYRISSAYPFKGNMDIDKLRQVVEEHGASRIAFVRMEAGTNLIGGQPFSLDNLAEVKSLCGKHGIPLILDASLLADNLYFIKVREEKYRDWSIREIARRIADLCDIIYFSGRKLGCARGGGMMTSNAEYFKQIREFIPLYEGFL
ncbi:MAG: tryptophanase, partial [Limnochordia bacterium]